MCVTFFRVRVHVHVTVYVVFYVVVLYASSPLEVSGYRQVLTLHHVHLSLWYSPSYITKVTHIRRHLRCPLYIILFLVGIPNNDVMSIVINIISETLHGKNREGLF